MDYGGCGSRSYGRGGSGRQENIEKPQEQALPRQENKDHTIFSWILYHGKGLSAMSTFKDGYADEAIYEATKGIDPRLEREEERKSRLEEELSMIESFEYMEIDLKEEVQEYYNREIRACDRNIAYFERAGA